VQPCAAPVGDSIMELLLTISCARRAGASKISAVIPYFGYKHHRRGSSISQKQLHSRFLTSGAMDFAKMLEVVGVDTVLAVDLQRPGQGHEACFFDTDIPLETRE
jgi:ribose-phosphate pyrophosphokinase